MNGDPVGPRLQDVWEAWAVGGREFLRARLDDPAGGDVAEYAVARRLGGRYEVGDVLSLGEMAVLLHARDLRTGRPVVVKALRTDLYPGDPGAFAGAVRHSRHLLQTERRLLVRLRNAGCNAVPVPLDYVYDQNPAFAARSGEGVDPFLVGTEPFLVLPHLEGETLDVVLARDFPRGIGERRALGMLLPVVRALEVLQRPWTHPNGRTWHCVYQDLKPDNLMVDPLGRLTLLDFGGCQVVVDGVPVLVGSYTPGYSPPECEGPARVLLPRADVYTVGATLLHMLTGVDPRARPGFAAGLPFDPDRDAPGASAGVRQFLARCLAPAPSGRLADARTAAEAIAALRASGIGPEGSDDP